MTPPRTDPAFEDADAFYAALVRAVDRAPSDGAAVRFLTRLTLVLANQIGSARLLGECLTVAEDQANTTFPVP